MQNEIYSMHMPPRRPLFPTIIPWAPAIIYVRIIARCGWGGVGGIWGIEGVAERSGGEFVGRVRRRPLGLRIKASPGPSSLASPPLMPAPHSFPGYRPPSLTTTCHSLLSQYVSNYICHRRRGLDGGPPLSGQWSAVLAINASAARRQ